MAASLWHLQHYVSSGRLKRIEFFAPQRKRTMDDLNVALDGLELLEIPLERFEIFQE